MLKGRYLQYAATLSGNYYIVLKIKKKLIIHISVVSLMIASSFMAILWPAPILPLLISEKTPLGRPITLVKLY